MGKTIQAYKLKARKTEEKRTEHLRGVGKDLDINGEEKANMGANENSGVSADYENKSFVDPPYSGRCNPSIEEPNGPTRNTFPIQICTRTWVEAQGGPFKRQPEYMVFM
jgi:hypothetical protein